MSAPGGELLLDIGNGAFGAWRAGGRAPAELGGVLITHLHADHFFDLVPLAYALQLWPDSASRSSPQLWLPPAASSVIEQLSAIWGDPKMFERAFEIHEYSPREKLQLCGLEIQLAPVPHYVPTVACALRRPNCESEAPWLVYGADCGRNEELAELARGAQHLICEATLEPDATETERDGHMTARDAGEVARSAAAENLWLTHYSDLSDAEQRERDAAEAAPDARVRALRAGDEISHFTA